MREVLKLPARGPKGVVFYLCLLFLTSEYCTHNFRMTTDRRKSGKREKIIDKELFCDFSFGHKEMAEFASNGKV